MTIEDIKRLDTEIDAGDKNALLVKKYNELDTLTIEILSDELERTRLMHELSKLDDKIRKAYDASDDLRAEISEVYRWKKEAE